MCSLPMKNSLLIERNINIKISRAIATDKLYPLLLKIYN